MQTNYDKLIPQGILFNLKQIADMNLIKVDMAKKLISQSEIEVVKIGNKLHISRDELIRYLTINTKHLSTKYLLPIIYNHISS